MLKKNPNDSYPKKTLWIFVFKIKNNFFVYCGFLESLVKAVHDISETSSYSGVYVYDDVEV